LNGDRQGALARVAESVADGERVDWARVEADTVEGRDRRIVRHLRLVENISALYRSIPPEADGLPAAVDDEENVPPGPRWGRLVLLERIGQGMSSEVFRAWDTELHREVALKLLLPEETGANDAHARILQEARRLARVRHPHVVQVYGAERHDDRVGLWMELVRGESLEHILKARGAFGAREASAIGQDLCAALAAVHGAGLLHRDVKAQNVVREEGGRIVLMDFGTGEELRSAVGTARLVGTPLYLAPEIFRRQPASPSSDLYSLGVLLFYLATGEFPVTAGSMEQLSKAHGTDRRRRMRDLRADLPASFVLVVERAVDPEPSARFGSAGEMEAALGDAAEGFQRGRTEPTPVTPPKAQLRPFWIVAASSLVVILALIVWSAVSRFGGATPALHRMAVLPMTDLSSPTTPPYLAAGLTDQLTSTLGQIEALQIAPRSSVADAKARGLDLPELAKLLNVDGFIESSVVVSNGGSGTPERVRVNVGVIAAGSGSVIWSRSFERALGDTLALETEITRSIARAVQAAITPAEAGRLDRAQQRRTTADVERACFEGRYNLMMADRAQMANDAFQRAVKLDPEYAPAQAGLAASYRQLGQTGRLSHPESRALSSAAVTKALTLDPDSSDAQTTLADLKFAYDWDWVGAGEAYSKALDLNGSSLYARLQYSRYLMAMRRFEQALVEAERAENLDPSSIDAAQVKGLVLYYKRDYQGALDALNHAVTLGVDRPGTHLLLSRVHAARGAFEDAIAETKLALSLSKNEIPGWRAHLVMLTAMAGDQSAATDGLATLIAELEKSSIRLAPEHLGYVHLALGNRSQALTFLEEAVDTRDPDIVFIAVDPRLDPLRSEPRFQQLIQKLGLP
jgi:serine/threonine protein kinase/Tfp pilus assembly protein PilF